MTLFMLFGYIQLMTNEFILKQINMYDSIKIKTHENDFLNDIQTKVVATED